MVKNVINLSQKNLKGRKDLPCLDVDVTIILTF